MCVFDINSPIYEMMAPYQESRICKMSFKKKFCPVLERTSVFLLFWLNNLCNITKALAICQIVILSTVLTQNFTIAASLAGLEKEHMLRYQGHNIKNMILLPRS